MNFRLIIVLILLLSVSRLFAQNDQDAILMTIHDREITLGEFERIYKKNNSSASIEQQSVDEYLELFINFKLKVIEAEELGYDTLQTFIREFTGYQKQLAKPYMSDKEEMEELLKEAYERAQFDIHASHILIKCDQDAAPQDTAIAYAKAFEIRQRILNGEDFATVARATSDDPSAKTNGGDLGYFTVFRMVYPFESAAYNTQPGEISVPARSRFGYHIIKVEERRPARGSVKVAHIMVLTPETMSGEQLKEAERKINALHDSLVDGADFAELARRNSEDRGSAARGGELAFFGTGRMVPEFEHAAFSITNPGEFSKPVKTSFGWHLLKLIERKEIGDFETMRAEYTDMINKSDRARYSKKATVERLKNEYNYTEFPGNLRSIYSIVDSTIFQRTWSVPGTAQLNNKLFVIDGQEYTQMQFAGYLESHQGGRQINHVVYVDRKFQEFVESSLIAYEEAHLPGKFPEYKHLLQEYHDGILLFDLTDKMVWSKAIQDSLGLEEFYREHKNDYMWEKRIDAVIYSCASRDLAEESVKIYSDKTNRNAPPSALAERLCEPLNDSSCITFTTGKYEKGDNELIDKMNWNNWLSEISENDGRFIFILKKDNLPAGPKLLDEARGLITADYQNQLEKLWISELRDKYPVKVNRKLLSTIE